MKKILILILIMLAVLSWQACQYDWFEPEPPPPPSEIVIVDFENGNTGPLTLNVMGNGVWDNEPVEETFTVVENPDTSGINPSSRALKFTRRGTDNGGLPWGGFWANADPNVDVTNYKYIHVMLWKNRVSPAKFKLQDGEAGTLETVSSNTQPAIKQWVDMVFDFTSLTGPYPVVACMPDFEDPLTLTGDDVMYIDNIRMNNDPEPLLGLPVVSFSAEILPIFNARCNMAGCHSPGGPSPDLTPDNAYNSLFAKNQIDLENPENSRLYVKMAPGGSMNQYTSSGDAELVLKWIQEGALKN